MVSHWPLISLILFCTTVIGEEHLRKRGRCPTLSRDYRKDLNCTLKTGSCSYDSDCPKEEKCCFQKCGFICIVPDTTPLFKVGECPRLQPIFAGSCNSTCINDEDCPDIQKCCSNGCGHECFNPGGLVTNNFIPKHEVENPGLTNRGGNSSLAIDLDLAFASKRSENEETIYQSGNLKKSKQNLRFQVRPPNNNSPMFSYSGLPISNAFFIDDLHFSYPSIWNSNSHFSQNVNQANQATDSSNTFATTTEYPINATEINHFLYRVPLEKIKSGLKLNKIKGLSNRSDNHSVSSSIFPNKTRPFNQFEVSPDFFPGTDEEVQTIFEFTTDSYITDLFPQNSDRNLSIKHNKDGHCPPYQLRSTVTCAELCSSDRNCSGDLKCCSNGCGQECLEPLFEYEKPGECPVLHASKIGVCIQLCSSDNNCTESKKCCSNGCGKECMDIQEKINKPGVCPRNNTQPKNSNRKYCVNLCENDSQCVDNLKCCQEGCNVKCLAPEFHVVVKPGLCPLVQVGVLGACVEMCANDSDCFREQKCCSNGCGHVCRKPIEVKLNPGVCPKPSSEMQQACFDRCFSDEDCGKVQKCCNNGCSKECLNPNLEIQASERNISPIPLKSNISSERKPTEKPGFCYPVNKTNDVKECAVLCNSDQQCDGVLKCCPSGCGFNCQEPSKVSLKDGHCPRVPTGYKGSCFNTCISDKDCFGEKKCCSNGCGHICFSPNEKFKKEGECAIVSSSEYFACYNFCRSDEECVGSKVCCNHGCSRICKEPQAPRLKIGECPTVIPTKYGTCPPNQCNVDKDCDGIFKCCINECGFHNCKKPAEVRH